MTNIAVSNLNLPERSVLGKFVIVQTVKSNDNALLYLAHDTQLNSYVLIEEFFPRSLVTRNPDGTVTPIDAASFKSLWDMFNADTYNMMRLSHPSICPVLNYFSHNSTLYRVFQHPSGETLVNTLGKFPPGDDLLKSHLLSYLKPIIDALNVGHSQNILAFNLNPENIFIQDNGNPLLFKFGDTLSFQLPAYKPPEFFPGSQENVGPWTDIFSLGAVIFRCLMGKDPVETERRLIAAIHRNEDPLAADLRHLGSNDPQLAKAISDSLSLNVASRTQNANEFLAALQAPPPSPQVPLAPPSQAGYPQNAVSPPPNLGAQPAAPITFPDIPEVTAIEVDAPTEPSPPAQEHSLPPLEPQGAAFDPATAQGDNQLPLEPQGAAFDPAKPPAQGGHNLPPIGPQGGAFDPATAQGHSLPQLDPQGGGFNTANPPGQGGYNLPPHGQGGGFDPANPPTQGGYNLPPLVPQGAAFGAANPPGQGGYSLPPLGQQGAGFNPAYPPGQGGYNLPPIGQQGGGFGGANPAMPAFGGTKEGFFDKVKNWFFPRNPGYPEGMSYEDLRELRAVSVRKTKKPHKKDYKYADIFTGIDNGKSGGFNVCAFLLGYLWLAYSFMLKRALILALFAGVLSTILVLILRQNFQYATGIFWLVIPILIGLIANKWLYSSVNQEINKVWQESGHNFEQCKVSVAKNRRKRWNYFWLVSLVACLFGAINYYLMFNSPICNNQDYIETVKDILYKDIANKRSRDVDTFKQNMNIEIIGIEKDKYNFKSCKCSAKMVLTNVREGGTTSTGINYDVDTSYGKTWEYYVMVRYGQLR